MMHQNAWETLYTNKPEPENMPQWLKTHQADAWSTFLALGIPSKKHEAWRQTKWHGYNMPTVLKTMKRPANTEQPYDYPFEHIALNLNTQTQQPNQGICLTQAPHPHMQATLNDLLTSPSAQGSSHKTTTDPMLALHQSCTHDIWFLHIGPDAPETPICLNITPTVNTENDGYYPMTLIVLAENKRPVTLIEHHDSASEQSDTIHLVKHITLKPHAKLTYLTVETLSHKTSIISQEKIIQSEGSFLRMHNHHFGSDFQVQQTEIQLNGKQSEAHWSAFSTLENKQNKQHHIVMDHHGKDQHSTQYAHAIGRDQSNGELNSLVRARPGSERLTTKQTSHNLLLSRQAKLSAKPNLAIDHEDVQCQHGATIGPLSDEALFYLKARGIGHDEALAMITHAFADTIIQGIEDKTIRAWVNDLAQTHKKQEEVTA
jgi:Fe-S cluster assembly scaffold protein SufB